LIQGSAAYLFKLKMRAQWEYFQAHPTLKSRFQMNIHDEMSWELDPADDPLVFFEVKQIMEAWEDAYIPIVAEMAFTKTTWADKRDVHTKEELMACITQS
jgi:DNA polymerase I-like protein with 3'-5' exonuclease and polymerase domains